MVAMTERNKEIHKSRKSGEVFRVIGERWGISTERVLQIYNREERKITKVAKAKFLARVARIRRFGCQT